VYVFEVPTRQGREWVDRIKKAVNEAKQHAKIVAFRETYGTSNLDSLRARVRLVHESDRFQGVLAFVIISGLIIDIVEAQMRPEGSEDLFLFFMIDIVITSLFTLELAINLFGNSNNSFRPFFSRFWNWFDSLIVVTSIFNVIVSLYGIILPNVKLLRLLRGLS